MRKIYIWVIHKKGRMSYKDKDEEKRKEKEYYHKNKDIILKKAKEYRKKALVSIKRNNRMNNLTTADFKKIGTETCQRLADAVLVDFINYVAVGQGIDLGLYTKHLKKK